MIDNVKQILRQVVMSKDKTTPTQSGLEVNILQFLYEYLLKASENQLIVVRSSLLSLMKEGLQLNFPPALFLLLVILRSYVQNIPLQEDKKVRKELQVTHVVILPYCNVNRPASFPYLGNSVGFVFVKIETNVDFDIELKRQQHKLKSSQSPV